MADENKDSVISLSVYVDKETNRFIYAECDKDFVDILFSFLTTPIGAIVVLGGNQSLITEEFGSIFNLYRSVVSTDVENFHSAECKDALLNPRSAAEHILRSDLKLNIYGALAPTKYFYCYRCKCVLLSCCENAFCKCGNSMSKLPLPIKRSKNCSARCFMKGAVRFMISDDLRVMPTSTFEIFSLFAELGVRDRSRIVERTINAGVDEVLGLLLCSLVSKMPIKEAILKCKKPENESINANVSYSNQHVKSEKAEKPGEIITLKLMVCKSKKLVCYAEASMEFVNLLFTILTIPLCHALNHIHRGCSSFRGCVDRLYKSAHDLNERFFESSGHKNILVNSCPVVGCRYMSEYFGIQEGLNCPYFFRNDYNDLYAQIVPISNSAPVISPLSRYDGGYLKGPTEYIVTDSLRITPISSTACFSILDEMKVPFGDIEEIVVQVGQDEALRLLASSLVSVSALTDTFIRSPK